LERFKVAIVIPAYNEESTISEVVKSVLQYGDAIVVNDASSDCTEKKALQAGAIIVNNETNCGYDKTLNNGFIEADRRNYDAVITFDADGQHNPVMLTEYVEYLKNGKDLVLGIRAKPARIAEWLFMKSTQISFNWKDPLCGMKGYSMKLYRKQGFFDSYGSIGTELAMFGIVNGYSYVQINVNIFTRSDKPRFYSSLFSNWLIIRALFKLYN
jgi:glycosyltransferase involved in cell wall biosynthesis